MKKLTAIFSPRILIHLLLLRPFVRLFLGINISGKANLRYLSQYVIIANHNSHLDVLLLFYLLPLRDIIRTHPIADKPYFSQKKVVFSLVNFLFQPIWVTRGKPDLEGDPLGEYKAIIEAGENIIIFPEGTRGSPGEVQQFKSGIGRLMAQYPDIPIVPIFLSGPERALPKGTFLLLPFWNHIVVGPPQKCVGSHRDITRSLQESINDIYLSESAHRHRRRAAKNKPVPVIAILGIDGSGKSTVSNMLAQKLSCDMRTALISDTLEFYSNGNHQEMQPLITEKLRTQIGRYAKKAKSLKVYKIPKLTELIMRDHLLHETERWYLPGLVVMDGAPLLNLAAWAALYKKGSLDDQTWVTGIGLLCGKVSNINRNDPVYKCFPEVLYLARLKLNRLTLPDVVVLLDVSPATACQRIRKRGEQTQVHETEEKLTALRAAYIKVCQMVNENWQVPTKILDGEESLEKSAVTAEEFIAHCLLDKDEK